MDVHKEYTPAIYTPDIKAVRQHSHALREEKEEMKKTYTKITVLICALITVVMLLGCALFTYVKVSEVNDTYMQRYSGLKEFSYEYRADTDLGDAIIGAYSTCGHLCRYCYANYDAETVRKNMAAHDPESPLLIGQLTPEDQVHEAVQESWIDSQISFFGTDRPF